MQNFDCTSNRYNNFIRLHKLCPFSIKISQTFECHKNHGLNKRFPPVSPTITTTSVTTITCNPHS